MAIIDSYSEANVDSYLFVGDGSNFGIYYEVGQSFTGDGGYVGSVQFYLKKFGSPTGNCRAKIYAHTGTFGTSSLPTGSAIATSDSVGVSSISALVDLVTFTFSGVNKIELVNTTKYVVVLEYQDLGDTSNYIKIGVDGSSPTHGGNLVSLSGGWSYGAYDLIFNVNTLAASNYYFDGHSGISDPDGGWTDDANAFDGSTSTFSRTSIAGSTSSNFLLGEGTNAPASGGTISQVRARVYGDGNGGGAQIVGAIYTDGLGELLGSPSVEVITPAYGGYVVLSTPSGGWTWAKLQALEVKVYASYNDGSGDAYKIEIEVTYSDSTTTSTTTTTVSTSSSTTTVSTSSSSSSSTTTTSTSSSTSTTTTSTSSSTSTTTTSTSTSSSSSTTTTSTSSSTSTTTTSTSTSLTTSSSTSITQSLTTSTTTSTTTTSTSTSNTTSTSSSTTTVSTSSSTSTSTTTTSTSSSSSTTTTSTSSSTSTSSTTISTSSSTTTTSTSSSTSTTTTSTSSSSSTSSSTTQSLTTSTSTTTISTSTTTTSSSTSTSSSTTTTSTSSSTSSSTSTTTTYGFTFTVESDVIEIGVEPTWLN